MGSVLGGSNSVQPVEHTLRWVVVTFRELSAVWVVGLVVVDLTGPEPGDKFILIASAVLAVAWGVVTVWASRGELLGTVRFAVVDGLVVLLLSLSGWFAGSRDFVSGGYPTSWLFVVALASSLRWTLIAGGSLMVVHTAIHLMMELGLTRTFGTFQFLVFALIAGWAFDAIRDRERLRVEAEARLSEEQRTAVRLEEGTRIAQKLHDSVLQTLQAIKSESESPQQIRYLARWQERELRRTIAELRSSHQDSFRVGLLTMRDGVEDLYATVRILDVIRDDAVMSPPLSVALSAAREAMTNAAKHSGSERIDLYSEISDEWALIHVRDRGIGFADEQVDRSHGTSMSIVEPVASVGGSTKILSSPGSGTEVTIRVPVA